MVYVYFHGYVQMEKEEGSFCKSRSVVPLWAIAALPQALIQQLCIIVETHLSYSDRDERKGYSMARMRRCKQGFVKLLTSFFFKLSGLIKQSTTTMSNFTRVSERNCSLCVTCSVYMSKTVYENMWTYRRRRANRKKEVNSAVRDFSLI